MGENTQNINRNIKKCPIEGCAKMFQNRVGPNSQKELFAHVAIVHLGVLQHVCRVYDRQNPKNEKAKQILSAFSAGATGDLYTCQSCKQIFGSSRGTYCYFLSFYSGFFFSFFQK